MYETMDNQQRKYYENLAYLVGVYLTDGYVLKTQFYLETIDRDFCEETIRAFGEVLDKDFNKNIRYIESREKDDNYSYSPTYRIKVSNPEFAKTIMDITDNKSRIPEYLLNGPKSVQLALLSGLMDGDGYCSKRKNRNGTGAYQIGLCGHERMYGCVRDYQRLLDKLRIQYKKQYIKNKPGFVHYNFKNFSFVRAGGYFRIKRKQNRVNDLIKEFDNIPACSQSKILNGIRSTSIMTAL